MTEPTPRSFLAPLAETAMPQSARRAVAAVLLFFAGLALTAFTVRTAFPLPFDEWERKLQFYEQHAEDYDVVLVGSSHVQRHLAPRTMEARWAEAGVVARVFNAGAWGADLLQIFAALERIAAAAPDRLRLVVIDPDLLRFDEPLQDARSTRWIASQDLATTWLTARSLFAGDRPPREVLEQLGPRVRSCAIRTLALGRIAQELEDRIALDEGQRRAREEELLGPAGDGFESLDDALRRATGSKRRGFLARYEQMHGAATLLPSYRRLLAQFEQGVEAPPPDPETEVVLAAILAQCRSLHARCVFVLSPAFVPRPGVREAATRGAIELFDYDRPLEHPELFDPALRFDMNHLDARGAELLSRTLADDLLPLLREDAE